MDFMRFGTAKKRSLLRRHGLRRFHRRFSGVENLEDRRLLAIVADWDGLTGELQLHSDSKADRIAIGAVPAEGSLSYNVTVNGQTLKEAGLLDGDVSAASVESLRLFGGLGDDELSTEQMRAEHFVSMTLVQIDGGAGDDSLLGSSFDEEFLGGAGEDLIVAGAGNDTLQGGLGDDRLEGGEGDDILEGQEGDDILRGDRGNDRYVFHGSASLDSDSIVGDDSGVDTLDFSGAEASVFVDLNAIATGKSEITKSWLAIDASQHRGIENVVGSENTDVVYGNELDNRIEGLAGNDMLLGAGGADELIGGAGNDRLYGFTQLIEDPDFIGPKRTPAGIDATADDLEGAGDDTTTPSVYGTDSGDFMIGGLGDDLLLGHRGADTLDGGEGDDKHYGGADADVIWAGPGDDELHGDAGNDTLRGDAGNDWISAGTGEDTVVFAGPDFLGRDVLSSSPSDGNTLDFGELTGGYGVDIDLGSTTSILVGAPGSRQLEADVRHFEIQSVIGTPYDDVLIGDESDNQLRGGAGDDYLVGAAGSDILAGGPGNDSVEGGFGSDTYAFSGSMPLGTDRIINSASFSDLATDTLDFSSTDFGSGLRLQLEALEQGPIQPFGENRLTLELVGSPVHNVIGSPFGDLIVGNRLSNRLDGQGGDDQVYGEGGADIIFGGPGHDELYGGPGNDRLSGDFGDDQLTGGAGDDRIQGGDGDDHLIGDAQGGHGNDTLDAGWGNDTIDAGPGDDSADGSFGNDIIRGDAGNDHVVGGQGDDALDGGEGDDRLFGESGDDTLVAGGGFDFVAGHEGDDRYEGNLLDTNLKALTFRDASYGTLVPQSVSGDGSRPFNGEQLLIEPAAGLESTTVIDWTLTGLAGTDYEIYATWSEVPEAASNALFTISDVNYVTLDSSLHDQRSAPVGEMIEGTTWQLVGAVSGLDSDALHVSLTNAGADGVVIANAIRIVDKTYYPPVAVNDVDVTPNESSIVTLQPIANDQLSEDYAATGEISEVTPIGDVQGEFEVAPDGQTVYFLPAPGVSDSTQEFEYTLTDGAGTSTQASGKIKFKQHLAEARVELADSSGMPLTSVSAGDEFRVDVFLTDLREEAATGVSAAVVDVALSTAQVSTVNAHEYGPTFASLRQPSIEVEDGLLWIHDIGAFENSNHSGEEALLFSAWVTASASLAVADISAQPVPAQTDVSEILGLRGMTTALESDSVRFVGAGPELVSDFNPLSAGPGSSAWHYAAEPADVNSDGVANWLDAQLVRDALSTRNGAEFVNSSSWVLADPAENVAFLDADDDGHLTVGDLQVVTTGGSDSGSSGNGGPSQGGTSAVDAVVGDFDGDGIDEILIHDPANSNNLNWRLKEAQEEERRFVGPRNRVTLVGDFTGDGRDDLAEFVPSSGQSGSWFVSSFSETRVQRWNWSVGAAFDYTPGEPLFVGDFDGNGAEDILRLSSDNKWVVGLSLTESRRFTSAVWEDTVPSALNPDAARVLDVNGDGRDDVLGQHGNFWRVWLSDSTTFVQPEASDGPSSTWVARKTFRGDFRGDGTQQLVSLRGHTNRHLVEYVEEPGADGQPTGQLEAIALGGSDFPSDWNNADTADDTPAYVADVDADGIDEIYYQEGSNWIVRDLVGTSFQWQNWGDWLDDWVVSANGMDVPQPQALNKVAIEAYEEVHNNIRLEHYAGFLKGANATEVTGRGNPWDQTALLKQKLLQRGVDSDFVSGRVSRPIHQVVDWLGVTHPDRAVQLLNEGMNANAAVNGGNIDFDHVWLDVKLTPTESVAVDPSWKFRNLQLGFPVPVQSVGPDPEVVQGQLTKRVESQLHGYFLHPTAESHSNLKRRFEVSNSLPLDPSSPYSTETHYVAFQEGELSLITNSGGQWFQKQTSGQWLPEFVPTASTVLLAEFVPSESDPNSDDFFESYQNEDLLPSHQGMLRGFDPDPTGGGSGSDYLQVSRDAQFGLISVTGDYFNRSDTLDPSQQLSRTGSVLEFLEDQVASYLHEHHAGVSLADIPYDGPIIQKRFDSLPVVTGVVTHTSQLPSDISHSVTVKLYDPQEYNPDDSSTYISATTTLEQLDGKAIRIDPEGAPSDAQRTVHIRFGADSLDARLFNNANLTVEVSVSAPGRTFEPHTFTRPIQPMVVALDGAQHSAESLHGLREKASFQMKLASTSVSTASRSLIWASLDYLGADFWHRYRRDQTRMHHFANWATAQTGMGVGLLTAPGNAHYHEGLTFPVILHRLFLDMPGALYAGIPQHGTDDGRSGTLDDFFFKVNGYNLSSLEHMIVEDFTNGHAISTVRGFQIAKLPGADNQLYELIPIFNPDGTYAVNDDEERTFQLLRYSDGKPVSGGGPASGTCLAIFGRDDITLDHLEGLNVEQQICDAMTAVDDPARSISFAAKPIHVGNFHGAVYTDVREQGFGVRIVDQTLGSANGVFGLNTVFGANNFGTFDHSAFEGDPVSLANGNMFHEHSDLVIPNMGIPLAFSRRYDAQNELDIAQLGKGWMHTYAQRLRVNAENLVWDTASGQHLEFRKVGSNYEAPDSWRGIAKQYNAPTTHFVLEDTDGIAHTFEQPAGSSYAYLRAIKDRNGNGVVITPVSSDPSRAARVADARNPDDRYIELWYDAANRLTSINDHTHAADRIWTYTVDSDGLREMKGPVTGIANRSDFMLYEYDAHGRVSEIEEPQGVTHSYTYYANSRVSKVTESDGHIGHVTPRSTQHSFAYSDINRRTDFTDQRGFVTSHYFGPAGETLKQVNPDGSREEFIWTHKIDVDPRDGVAMDDQFESLPVNGDPNDLEPVYIMYSAESVHTRFNSQGQRPHRGNTDHLIGVRYTGGNWKYNYNKDNVWINFTPRSTDLLLADVLFFDDQDDELKDYKGMPPSDVNGIRSGYLDGDLSFSLNTFAGAYNPGEVGVSGSYFSVGHFVQVSQHTNTIGQKTEYFYDGVFEDLGTVRSFEGTRTEYDYFQRPFAGSEALANMQRAIGNVHFKRVFDETQAGANLKQNNYQYPEVDPSNGGTLPSYPFLGNLVLMEEQVFTGDLRQTFFSYFTSGTHQGLLHHRIDPRDVEEPIPQGHYNVFTRRFEYSLSGQLQRERQTLGVPVLNPDEGDQNFNVSHTAELGLDRRFDSVGRLIWTDTNVSAGDDLDPTRTTYSNDSIGRPNAVYMPEPYTSQLMDDNGDLVYPRFLASQTNYHENGAVAWHKEVVRGFQYFFYDFAGRLYETTSQSSRNTSRSYDEMGNVIEEVDGVGNRTRYVYDSRDRRIQTIFPDGTSELVRYDAEGKVVSIINQRGHESTFEYDYHGRLVKTTDALGHETTTDYNGFGNALQIVDTRGYATEHKYDAFDRVIQTKQYFGHGPDDYQLSTFEYDNHDNLVRSIEWDVQAIMAMSGGTLQSDFMAAVNPPGQEDDWIVAAVLGTSDPRTGQFADVTQVTEFSYDSFDRLVRRFDADGYYDYRAYDTAGNQKSYADEKGRYTRYRYDNLSRLHREILTAEDGTNTGNNDHGLTITTVLHPNGDVRYVSEGTCANDCTSDSDFTERRRTNFYYNTARDLSARVDAHGNSWDSVYDAAGRLVITVDPLDRANYSQFDAMGRVVLNASADPDLNGPNTAPTSRFEYDANSNLVAEVDARGFRFATEYDALDRVTSTVLPNELAYSDDGDTQQPSGSINQANDSVHYNVTTPGVYKVTAEWSHSATTNYDHAAAFELSQSLPGSAVRHTIARVSMNLNATTEGPIELGQFFMIEGSTEVHLRQSLADVPDITIRLQRVTAGAGERYLLDSAGNAVAMLRPRHQANGAGNAYEMTTTRFDGFGRPGRVDYEDPQGLNPAPYLINTYDSFGNLSSERDHVPRTTTYTYDKMNRLESIELPDPDGDGNLVGPTTVYQYDAVGNQTHVHRYTVPVNTLPAYDHSNPPDDDLTTEFRTYDSLNRVVEVHRDYGQVGLGYENQLTEIAYDLWGNVVQQDSHPTTGGPAYRTSYTYNKLDQLILEQGQDPDTDSSNGSEQPYWRLYKYDVVGNLLEDTEILNHGATIVHAGQHFDFTGVGLITSHEYDRLNRVIATSDPNSTNRSVPNIHNRDHTSWLEYDAAGNLVALKDAEGSHTRMDYDGLGRMVLETDAHGLPRVYEYDASGNLLSKVDRRQRETRYQYDPLGRITREQFISPTDGSTSEEYVWRYDAEGRIKEEFLRDGNSDLLHHDLYEYDGLDRITKHTQLGSVHSQASSQPSIRYEYVYDDNGDVTITEFIGNATRTADYLQYDRLAQLDGILTSTTGTDPFAGSYPKNFAFDWDGLGRMKSTSVTLFDGLPNPIHQVDYDYDQAGRLTDIDGMFEYDYDRVNRIEAIDETGAIPRDISVGYDKAGQLESFAGTGLQDETFEYDEAGNRDNNGEVRELDNRISEDNENHYYYDDEGNLERIDSKNSDAESNFFWDHRNRLVRVGVIKANGEVAKYTYTYDANDRRVRKTVFEGYGDNNERYSYRDGNLRLVLTDDPGEPQKLVHRYLQTDAVDQVLADDVFHDDGTRADTVWFMRDQLGSVRRVLKGSGDVAQTITYDAFGSATVDYSGSTLLANGHIYDPIVLYAGREWDADAQLHNNRARWYDPDIGRFLSTDPIGFAGGDANLYRYVGNSPTNFTDPSGLSPDVFPDPFAYLRSSGDGGVGGIAGPLSGNNLRHVYNVSQTPGTLQEFGELFNSTVALSQSNAFEETVLQLDAAVFRAGRIARNTGQLDVQLAEQLSIGEPVEATRHVVSREIYSESILDVYDREVAAGRYTPNFFQRAGVSLARRIFVRNDPNYLVTYSDGTTEIDLGGGPSTGDLAGQAFLTHGAANHGLIRSFAAEAQDAVLSTVNPILGFLQNPFGRRSTAPGRTSSRPPVTNDSVTARMRIENTAQQTRNTAPPRGLGGRTISAPDRAQINAFGDRARAVGLVENPNRTGSWGRVENGRFHEVARIDTPVRGMGGHQAQTHLYIEGVGNHLPVNTPLPGE